MAIEHKGRISRTHLSTGLHQRAARECSKHHDGLSQTHPTGGFGTVVVEHFPSAYLPLRTNKNKVVSSHVESWFETIEEAKLTPT
jgi:hypothetical protein